MKVPKQRNQKGVTLVLALLVILLLTVIIVALLTQSQSATRSSSLHADAVKVRQLAQSALAMVSSQIQEATTTQPGYAWASQPGAIHVRGPDGNPASIFKLYSADVDWAGSAADLLGDIPPVDWQDLPHLFVDLNEPIRRGGSLSFPIADPRLFTGDAANDPEGFSYDSSISGTVLPSSGELDDQRLPMPVRWLYVLSDGTITPAENNADGTVSIVGAGADAEIIGRIAFWTDDETSKVNINTAAGGVFWDTPRVNSLYDYNLAYNQPVQGEFQRYPGHPATVDLRSVFRHLDLDALYGFVPKIQPGGSDGGLVLTSAVDRPPPIIPDEDRLYASIGEARFTPDRGRFGDDSAYGPAFEQRVERGSFLLTTSSRSPEINLFGHPRVSIWPMDSNPADRSPLDRLIAMCSTTRVFGQTMAPFYFQRREAGSATHDIENIPRNRELLAYLRRATDEPVPGFGGSFATKYGGPRRDQILTQVFDYIRGATNLKDPLGRKFADPIPYVSGDLNKQNGHMEEGEGQVVPIRIEEWGTQGFGRFHTVSEAFLWITWQGQGNNSATAENDADPATAPSLPLPETAPGTDEVQIQAVFAMQFVGVTAGYSEISPDMTIRVQGLDQLTLNGENMGFPADGSVVVESIGDVPIGGIMDFRALVRDKQFSRDEDFAARFPFYSNILTIPRVGASTIPAPEAPVIISIYSGAMVDENRLVQTLRMRLPEARFTAPLRPVLQSNPANQVPRRWGTGVSGNDENGIPHDRFRKLGSRTRGRYMDNNDRTRSMVSSSGDHRVTAALRHVPESFFTAHRGANGTSAAAWQSNTVHLSSLQNPLGYGGYSGNSTTTGRFDAAVTFASGVARPPVPTHVRGKPAGAVAWDWDTGIAARSDGPFINKPDEGSLGRTTGNVSYFKGSETAVEALDETMFLPNRQIPSPGMFGSLPTGINPGSPETSVPWQTLHLRPDPVDHPGNATPPDHLLLDLFWMPVVEPYAISEPFSTAGKVNMNARLVPFPHITRETALYAALSSERLLALTAADMNDAKHYKDPESTITRLPVDVDETLNGFRQHFDSGEIFLSPTEISTLYLVPEGETLAGTPAFWANASSTGDNVREKPYANLLAKLTTKSNAYAVHVVAQALSKGGGGNPATFGETSDRVTAEWQGTFLIERFLDPNDPRLPDFAGPDARNNWGDPLYNAEQYYQMRVLQVKEWR